GWGVGGGRGGRGGAGGGAREGRGGGGGRGGGAKPPPPPRGAARPPVGDEDRAQRGRGVGGPRRGQGAACLVLGDQELDPFEQRRERLLAEVPPAGGPDSRRESPRELLLRHQPTDPFLAPLSSVSP